MLVIIGGYRCILDGRWVRMTKNARDDVTKDARDEERTRNRQHVTKNARDDITLRVPAAHSRAHTLLRRC